MSTPTTAPSPQARAATHLFECYNAHDMKALADCLSEDFTQILLPKSLGRAPKTKQEWLTYITPFTVLIPDHTVWLHYKTCVLEQERDSWRVMR
jgi:ketosteroid isomerase-like protein